MRRLAAIRLVVSLFVSIVCLLLTAAPSLYSQPPAVAARYMGREIATTMHFTGADWLMRQSRQREEDCKQLLKELQVKPGQVICDMGCGNGFYTLKLAQLTGKTGRVYAVDIQQKMLDMLQRRAHAVQVQNIVPLLGTETNPRLPENSIDLVLMVDVYHEFSQPAAMLKATRKSLKPAGRIALVEFRAEDPQVPIKPEHKMSKQQILKEFPANGLKLTGQFDKLPWQHLMFFSRGDAEKATFDESLHQYPECETAELLRPWQASFLLPEVGDVTPRLLIEIVMRVPEGQSLPHADSRLSILLFGTFSGLPNRLEMREWNEPFHPTVPVRSLRAQELQTLRLCPGIARKRG